MRTGRSTGRVIVPRVPIEFCLEMLKSTIRNFQDSGVQVSANVKVAEGEPPTLVVFFPGFDMVDLGVKPEGEEVEG